MPEATAVMGAITGTLGLALSLFQEVRHRLDDTRSLRVQGRLLFDASEGMKPVLSFTLTNMGRRVIRVKLFSATLINGAHITGDVFVVGLPKTLGEHEEHQIVIPAVIFQRIPDIAGFYATDTTGKEWELHHVEFVEMQAAVRRALEEERGKAPKAREPIIAGDLFAARSWPPEPKRKN